MNVLRHPILELPRKKRVALFGGALVLTFVALSIFPSLDVPLKTPEASWGMVSFEFAKTAERSAKILDSWNVTARNSAHASLLLDCLFPVCYSTMLTIACFWAARLFRERGYTKSGWLATAIAWAQWPAAACDYVENFSLWMQLRGSVNDPWPGVAFTCASIKFLLIAAALCILVAAIATWVLRRRARPIAP